VVVGSGGMGRVSLRKEIVSRLGPAASLLALAMVVGTAGYHVLGGGRWAWQESAYMTAITLSTVGYGELPEMASVPYARLWTVVLIVFGSGSLVYFVSVITALIVEGDLTNLIKKDRMQRAIDAMSDHIVVCGLGATGRHVVGELIAAGAPFIVVDRDVARITELEEDNKREIIHVIGDVVADDRALEEAGIVRAKALVASLHDDRDNLFVVLSARALNEKLRIVSKADDTQTAAKLKRAGANDVVLPALIGGMRIASQLVRPTVVQFLDDMLRDKHLRYRIEEVYVSAGCAIANRTIGDIAEAGLAEALVLAVRDGSGKTVYNPSREQVVGANAWLIVLARMDEVVKFRKALGT
jgi:voltage-gated potassium channel